MLDRSVDDKQFGDNLFTEQQAALNRLLLYPVWKKSERSVANISYEQHEIIVCEGERAITQQLLETSIQGANCTIFRSEAKEVNLRYVQYANQLFTLVKHMLSNKARGNILIQLVLFASGDQELFQGLCGLLKTARLENPKLFFQMIVFPAESKPDEIISALKADSLCINDQEIRYIEGVRYTKQLSELKQSLQAERLDRQELPWREGGIYLITGGVGGIGLIVAEEIIRHITKGAVILVGRSELSGEKRQRLAALKRNQVTISYHQADITEEGQVKQLIEEIMTSFGSLHGIIHSAGIINDQYIIHKTEQAFTEVLHPKVTGLHYLDMHTKALNLDFIMLFSSEAAEMGNLGQADYAAANGFMDRYAAYRNWLAEKGERSGKTVSINWPLWAEGGMSVNKEIERRMLERSGMIPLTTKTGIATMYVALHESYDQLMVVEGDLQKLSQTYLTKSTTNVYENLKFTEAASTSSNSAVNNISDALLQEKAEHYFKQLLASVIKLDVDRIHADAPLEKYGIDSLVIMKMNDELEKNFGELSKTLFFEYQNIRSIAAYFLEAHRDKLLEQLGLLHSVQQSAHNTAVQVKPVQVQRPTRRSRRKRFMVTEQYSSPAATNSDIAIIGVAGRYPQAKNVDEFWHNLCSGRDCITEIPKDRWDHKQFHSDTEVDSKSNARWGGFLDDIDRFDPMFFNIPPREAEWMDPQERLFLECVVELLEDAGYTRQTLSRLQGTGIEGNVGVYVGVMYDEYQLYGAQEQAKGRMIALSSITSSIANRVSYFCNFHGPSIGVNTMCSSSLTAIHLACQSIRLGECELAIAGGVNVSIHPNKYILLERGHFLSSKGKCESFGKDGDGYVPGEGVGAILLKPLSKAIADQDQIYGVIKGSAINHGGKTNGYTVPNPNAQANLIRKALKDAGVDARHLSYIEAHGTGTALGDPIEITALTKAFEAYTNEKQFCAIGSVKSNIGHLESAAGIAGVTKVLLQMKYGKLVPSLHAETLNPNINFTKTPFKVQRSLEEWHRPVTEKDGIKQQLPRIAGISAFGAGGSNAHLVIEEYLPQQTAAEPVVGDLTTYMIVLSAKQQSNLRERVKQLLQVIEEGKITEQDLPHVAYTLQVGREPMEARLAMTAKSLQELEQKLKAFLNGQEEQDWYSGIISREQETLSYENNDANAIKVDSLISEGNYKELLQLWVNGLNIDWERCYSQWKPKRISLPTYPFSEEHYWVPGVKRGEGFRVGGAVADISNVAGITNAADISNAKEAIAESFPSSTQQQSISEHKADNLPKVTQSMLKEKTIHYLKSTLSAVSGIPFVRIENDASLEGYGIDSVMIKQLARELEQVLGQFSPTIFFEYQTIQALAEYCVMNFEDKLIAWFGLGDWEAVSDQVERQRASVNCNANEHSQPKQHKETIATLKQDKKLEVTEPKTIYPSMDIAIIGLAGRYPGADTLEQFWNNLQQGMDCIAEVPNERWDYKQYYSAEKGKPGKINSKWGGFINDVDKFDPLFFNISPDDAERLDPQERLFLQCVYETIEDAGYTRTSLCPSQPDELSNNVGVFVGVTFLDYQLLGVEKQVQGKPLALSGIASSIANRVSYFCNFNGPSMTIDSMCSSSLTALHVACDSIKLGRCKLAVVGGVNLCLHPNKYLFLSQYHFMSSKGKCESFGSGGDGYVPGEGVGAVLLKPLAQAVADGDHIYGVIKATSANHGGKTNGYSVPNPAAQAQVIQQALKEGDINPRTISYIEAHGTGTSLGDPIEIAGLTKAFQTYTNDCNFCSIGSLKSNIGHLEAAAGIAGLTKVLLQLKYKQLVPSLHSQKLNEHIDFEQTPFYVQQKLQEWKRPVVEVEGKLVEFPRIAGVSSFGAGGSNSHVIIEEYVENESGTSSVIVNADHPAIIVLSAKRESLLKEQAIRLLEFIRLRGLGDEQLANIAYTLQIGRESMEYRLGIIVSTMEELTNKLESYIQGKTDTAGLYMSHGRQQRNVFSLFKASEELQEVLQLLLERKKATTLLELWIAGVEIEWASMYKESKPQRMSLPTYPFAQERYWIPDVPLVREVAQEKPEEENLDKNMSVSIHSKTAQIEAMLVRPIWQKSDLIDNNGVIPQYSQRLVLLCEGGQQISVADIEASLAAGKCRLLHSDSTDLQSKYADVVVQLFKEVQEMLQAKRRGQQLVQLVVFNEDGWELYRGLGGLLKTAQQEYPKLSIQIIGLPAKSSTEEIIAKLREESLVPHEREINYIDGVRYTRSFAEEQLTDQSTMDQLPWQEGGTYLLSGGAGGLGLIFAEEICRTTKNVQLILTGRSALSTEKGERLEQLRKYGANIQYKRLDIADYEQVQQLITEIIANYGKLNGIFHCAGVIQDKFIINKSAEEIAEVIAPKVGGLLNLDQCTSGLELDFMVLFSSGAGQFGNPGQADYAAANAFLDIYSVYRNKLVAKGERSGKTVSINWPLWKHGGMQINQVLEQGMFARLGMIAMNTDTGIKALYQALQQKDDQLLVFEGDLNKIRANVLQTEPVVASERESELMEEVNLEQLTVMSVQKLKNMFGESIKLPSEQINEQDTFDMYGADSVKLTLLSQQLAEYFEEISNTIFFEYRTIAELASYLAAEFPYECRKWIGDSWPRKEVEQSQQMLEQQPILEKKSILEQKLINDSPSHAVLSPSASLKPIRSTDNKRYRNENEAGQDEQSQKDIDENAIAIIGVSAQFPMANNIEQFWENIKSAKNCITEVSKERWPLENFYNPDREEAINRKQSCSKWGGFLEEYANFDPLFFNIAPADAERMDPQERLFLEQCWKAIEDAGIVPSQLEKNERSQIGVFGAATKTGFNLWNTAEHSFYTTSFSAMVNRFSYFADFQGMSIPVDTMCSSSLTALHQACEAIRRGEITTAVVGAVNLYTHPTNYTSLTQGGLLSDSSSSTVLGKGGNGFIPSEGVGAVVLKSLSAAKRDNNHIWAIIKGTAIAHSGRTNGYSVPDPAKQAAVIRKALEAAKLQPETIQHIEAAASGSELVDSMEMSAIRQVFGNVNNNQGGYTLGSLKAILGHGEAVSGMAQLIKAILQLKHKIITPIPLPKQLNPHIPFDKIPFKVVTELQAWSKLELNGEKVPRRIGINSFGAGGVYSHVIVEEYESAVEQEAKREENSIYDSEQEISVFLFSAKTKQALRSYMELWKQYVEQHPELDLQRLAYVLQMNREHFKCRFAVIAQNRQALLKGITQYLQQEEALLDQLEPLSSVQIEQLIANRDWLALAQLWQSGVNISWEKLKRNRSLQHMPLLPTYPFSRKRFWPYVASSANSPSEHNGSEASFISIDSIVEADFKIAPENGITMPIQSAVHSTIATQNAAALTLEPGARAQSQAAVLVEEDKKFSRAEIEQCIKDVLIDLLYLEEFDEFAETDFTELGLDSIRVTRFIKEINCRLNISLSETVIYDYVSVSSLATYIAEHLNPRRET